MKVEGFDFTGSKRERKINEKGDLVLISYYYYDLFKESVGVPPEQVAQLRDMLNVPKVIKVEAKLIADSNQKVEVYPTGKNPRVVDTP